MSSKSGKTRVACVLLSLFLLLLTVAACKPQAANQPSGEQEQGAPSSQGALSQNDQKTNLTVYYVKITADDACLVRETHQVPYTEGVIKAALEELINADPVTPGAARVLPAGTKIRGVSIKDGLATVDFSRDVLRASVGAAGEELGIQSIVNTVTEFPGVQKVSFQVEGTLDQEAKNWWGHVGLYAQPFVRDVTKVKEQK